MRKIDDQEREIVRQLIKDPRISDNQLSKKTNIPVMSVNRKRKKLEEEGLLHYHTYLNTTERGTGTFHARQLYILKFKLGITREKFIKHVKDSKRFMERNAKHIFESFMGEKDGQFSVMVILDAKNESELVEVFNGKIIPHLKEDLGDDCISEVTTCKINIPIRLLHNYMPFVNLENGRIKPDWSNNWIFVSE